MVDQTATDTMLSLTMKFDILGLCFACKGFSMIVVPLGYKHSLVMHMIVDPALEIRLNVFVPNELCLQRFIYTCIWMANFQTVQAADLCACKCV